MIRGWRIRRWISSRLGNAGITRSVDGTDLVRWRTANRSGLTTRTVTSSNGNRPRRLGHSSAVATWRARGPSRTVTLRREARRLGHSASVTVTFDDVLAWFSTVHVIVAV